MTDRNLAGQRFGEFVLREQIAEGGSGAVYRSDQPRLNREVVVKVLRDARRHHRGAQARFQREAQLASRLDHPFAVHVYAFGLDHDTWWIAMELVPGITLDAWLQRRGPMPLEQFAPFFECLADVVHCMHERGIVHRDLKPSNVMVVHSGDRLIPKLLDLGIAKAPQDSPLAWPEGSLAESRPKGDVTRTDPAAKDWNLTPSGIGIGSSAYMAPEQWDSASTVGPASDIYALGVLAYKALTGRAPFTGTSTGEYYLHHKQTPVPPVGGDLPRSLDAIFQRALAKQPGDRYPTALAFAAELGAAMRASERALLRSHAEQWQTQARPAALLLQGDVLAEVERWTERTRPELTPLECSYFASSQRRARRAARLRRAAIVLAAVAIVGTSLGVLQYRAAMRTELAEQQTRTARQLTEATIVQSEIEQGRAALLHGEPEAFAHLAEAYRRGDHSPATSFMLARAIQPRLQEQARLPSSSGRMWSAAFSPDGTQIVTTDEHNAQLWDAQSFQRQHLLPHDQQVFGAAYSRDGTQLATASVSTVKLWDPRTGRLLRELRHPSAGRKPVEYFRVAISPDNRWVAAITLAGAVAHLWDAASGEVIADIANDGFEHPGIAFAGDGRWLVTGSGDDVRVFDMRARKPGLVLSGLHVLRWALDPTGPRLAIGTTGGEISIRDLATGAPLHMLRTA
ncbi:MAG TPA: serine/threonine-protein kinase, partial [Kofleriaceae bacterium]